MLRHEISLPDGRDASHVELWLEQLALENGIAVSAPRALRTIPGSVHWHLSRGRGSGTLEVTIDPGRALVILAVHENRRGNWAWSEIDHATEKLRDYLGACSG